MKEAFTKPMAHFIPLVEGMEAQCLASLSTDELADIVFQCKQKENQVVFQKNPDVLVREIGSEWVLVPTGDYAQHFNGMISLNEFSYFVWDQLSEPKSLGQLLQAAYDEFEDEHHMLDIQLRDIVFRFYHLGLFQVVKPENNV